MGLTLKGKDPAADVQSIAKTEKPAEKPVATKPTPAVVTPAKASEINQILAAIKKSKGDQMVVKGNSIPQVERLATGVFEFDLATGGGFPKGRYSIVYGPESSGKTNSCYCAAAMAQKQPAPCNVVVWVDLEGTFDPDWAAQFGIDVDLLLVVKPGYGEEAADVIDALIRAEEVALLVVDSLAMVISTKEIGQSAEAFDVGTASILIKRICNKMVLALSEEGKRGHNPAVIFVNQTRFKIGVMFGDPETMPGGQTMKFLSSLTIRLSAKNVIDKSISPEVHAFKDTHAVIKKAKVPITQSAFDYKMGVLPQVGVGTTNSWNTVSGHLKDMGVLSKVEKGTGWQLYGEVFPTLIPIQQRYLDDKAFAAKLHTAITESQSGKFFLLAAEGAAKG